MLVAAASSAFAGDRVPVVQVKFSPSSSRVMAVTAGVLDGSGFGFASLDILNTLGGVALYHKQKSADVTAAVARAQLLSTPPTPATLSANGLTPGIISAPKFQRAYATQLPAYTEAVLAGGSQVTNVVLWTVPVPIKLSVSARPSTCTTLEGHLAAGFTLNVRNQVIHADAPTLPVSRQCQVGYTVDRVDVRGNRILVTVRAYSFGFEGPDAKPIFIAAKLN